jgi:hypothetical protein
MACAALTSCANQTRGLPGFCTIDRQRKFDQRRVCWGLRHQPVSPGVAAFSGRAPGKPGVSRASWRRFRTGDRARRASGPKTGASVSIPGWAGSVSVEGLGLSRCRAAASAPSRRSAGRGCGSGDARSAPPAAVPAAIASTICGAKAGERQHPSPAHRAGFTSLTIFPQAARVGLTAPTARPGARYNQARRPGRSSVLRVLIGLTEIDTQYSGHQQLHDDLDRTGDFPLARFPAADRRPLPTRTKRAKASAERPRL